MTFSPTPNVDTISSAFDPVRTLPPRRPLVDDVYDTLLGLLMDHVIEPGSRAKIEDLARQLGVSPTPVREALARLESEGLVRRSSAVRGYVAAPLLDAEGLADLYEMRILLEPRAAARCATRIQDGGLDSLLQLNEAMARAAAATGDHYQQYREFAGQDARFHRLVAESSGNALLADAIVRLRPHMHLYRLYFQHGIASETLAEHAIVLDALTSHDADAAAEAMRGHIEQSYRRMAHRTD